MILTSFLNLSFLPAIQAMEDPDTQGGEERPLLNRSNSPSQASLIPLHDEESQSRDLQRGPISEEERLAPFLAYCQRLQGVVTDENRLFVAFSYANLGLDPEPSKAQKYGLPIGTGLIASGAAAALAELYMFDSGVDTIIGLPAETFYGLPPTRAVIAGIFAGGLLLIGGGIQLEDRLSNMMSTSSKYQSKAEEEQSLKKKVTLAGLTLVTATVFGFKGLYAFATTNTGQGVGSTVFAAIAGPFYGTYKLIVVSHFARTKWTEIFKWTEEKIYRWGRSVRPGQEEREVLRKSLANSLRKVIADTEKGGEVETLFDEIHELHKAGKNQMNRWQEEIKRLQGQLSRLSPNEDKEKLHASIEVLKTNILFLQRTLTLATLKMLSDFDKEERYFPKHLKKSPWYGHQPWWYRAAQGGGFVLGGLSAYAIGWAWKFITSTLDHPIQDDDGYVVYYLPNAVADIPAVLITMFYVPCLAVASSSILAKLASAAMKYNPVQNDAFIETSDITYSRARGVATFLNWCSHTYQEIPGALVGGTGMGYAGIPLADQWWTLAPTMAVMGAGSHVLSEETLQKYVTKLMNRFYKSKGDLDAKRQFIGDLLKASDDFLKVLRGDYILELKGVLDQDFEEIFKIENEHGEGGAGEGEEITPEKMEEGDTSYLSVGHSGKKGSNDIPLRTTPKGEERGQEDSGEKGSENSDDSGLPEFLEERVEERRPGTKEGLTARLLEPEEGTTVASSPPSKFKAWLRRNLTDPLVRKLRGKGAHSPTSSESGTEMHRIQDI